MYVKNRGKYYKLPLKYFLIVEYYKLILRIRRFKRWMVRIFVKNTQLYFLQIVVLLLIIITIIILVKKGIYYSFLDGILDFKDSIIITVLGTFIYNTFTYYNNWHRVLKSQYELYYSLMCESEELVGMLLYKRKYICSDNIFIDRTIADNISFKKISKKLLYYEFYNKKSTRHIFNDYIATMKKYKEELVRCNAIDFDKDSYSYYMLEIIELINDYDNYEFFSFIKLLVNYIYELISTTRNPWRWDYTIDKKIRKILRTKKIGNINKNIFDTLDYYFGEKYYDIDE